MAPTRRGAAPVMYDGDTDQESEQETPKPKGSRLKKRLSEAYIPDKDNEASSSGPSGANDSSGSRPPLRSVNINDDAAEKRRRRKSTKMATLENLGVDDEGADAGPAQPEAGSSQANVDAPRQVGGLKPRATLNSIAQMPEKPITVDSTSFEEWMKLATDNKINSNNAWDFALIDYFADMTLLRDTGDNSINFQRASCTLDASVKVWTSRVDSVVTETGKLLSNLESEGRKAHDEGEDSDNPEGGDPAQPKKRKQKTGNGTTLAKDAAQLKNKKPDVDFSVDPLFKKTCADFDEGGAGGLLMNHLSLGIGDDACMRIIFDGSDPMGKIDDDETTDIPVDIIDIGDLRQRFLPDLSILEDKVISESLESFNFGRTNRTADDIPSYNLDVGDDYADDDSVGGGADSPSGGNYDVSFAADEPVEDFFTGANAVNDDYNPADFNQDEQDDPDHSGEGGAEGGAPRNGPYVAFDPRRTTGDHDIALVMGNPGDENDALQYFDQAFGGGKGWAGPEHWVLRRKHKKAIVPAGEDEEGGSGGKTTKSRQKKEVVTIDFTTPLDKTPKELANELFEKPGKGASINLPGTGGPRKGRKQKKEKKDDHRLPDDMHFSSKQLVTLFLKPKFYLKMRGRKAKMTEGGDEVDTDFWAQTAQDQAAGRALDNNDDMNDAPPPFSTQFFNDADDDFGGGFDDDGGFDGGDPSGGFGGATQDESVEQDLLRATAGQTRRVRPEFVKYAKKAKRVDVRKLKENIWKNLDIVAPDKDDSMDVDGVDSRPATDPDEARQFTQVISGLQKSYPKEKMEEISTSFCFICLLHLANEQGLKLESNAQKDALNETESDEEDTIQEDDDESMADVKSERVKKVGDIWDIKIYRDPTATKSA